MSPNFFILGETSTNAKPIWDVLSVIFFIELSISKELNQSPSSTSTSSFILLFFKFLIEELKLILVILYLLPSKTVKFTMKSFLLSTKLEFTEIISKSIYPLSK